MSALDVGQGDAILIDFGYRAPTETGLCRTEWLVDGGPSTRRAQHIGAGIDCELDAFVLTHPHADHYVGGTTLLENRYMGEPTVGAVYTNGETRGPPRDDDMPSTWAAFAGAAAGAELELTALEEGQVLEPAPGRRVRVLWTGGADGGHFPDTSHGSDINNDSLVLMLEYAGRRVLLTGDTETEAQEELLERYCTPEELERDGPCVDLQADVLKVPHHGSVHVSWRFFRAVAPDVALISAGHRNRQYWHPRAAVVQFLLELGAEVYSTSTEGEEGASATISADGELAARGPEGDLEAWSPNHRDGGWLLTFF